MSKRLIPVVAVVGPTASGKTRLAVELALRFNGEVVSADSMQIYEGMDIATAKPTEEEKKGIRHHMISVVPPGKVFSVADFVSQAKKCIEDIDRRGKLPIVAGGTGLYVDSLLENIEFAETKADYELRKKLREKAERDGPESLLSQLGKIDPETAEKLHPNNLGRIIRAIEVFETSGITMSQQREMSRKNPPPYRTCMIGLNFEDRQKLYDRINLRVDMMLEAGLLEEAEKFLKTAGGTSMQAIGYKELRPYIEGRMSLEEAAGNLKRETRRYAKRQLTWFKRNEKINWLYADTYNSFDDLAAAAEKTVRDFLRE